MGQGGGGEGETRGQVKREAQNTGLMAAASEGPGAGEPGLPEALQGQHSPKATGRGGGGTGETQVRPE